jgi:hypothetical protein
MIEEHDALQNQRAIPWQPSPVALFQTGWEAGDDICAVQMGVRHFSLAHEKARDSIQLGS